ncbi:MAG: alpha/beta hydrolase [Chloroflexi bacterium]|nr:alpha/beta hydrolase [Chloroflexota bacterium]
MSNWKAEDGVNIYYEVYGSDTQKDVLLLLPGLIGSISKQWAAFTRPLSTNYRLVLMDLRGHGRSENNSQNLQIERMLRDIIGLLTYLKSPALHVAGYSIGGYLGLMLAMAQPQQVKTLLMHGVKFYWTEESAQKMRAQLDPDQIISKAPAYADQLAQEHGARQWRILVRQAADLTATLVSHGIHERELKRLRTPTLISVGDRDELVPLNEAQRLSRTLPNGSLIVLPGVHHPFQTIRPIPLLPMMQEFHK